MCIEVRDPAGRPCAGVPVWVEQETHAFVFGCVAPDLQALLEPDRQRCLIQLNQVFNRLTPAGQSPDPGVIPVRVPEGVELGRFQRHLAGVAGGGLPLEVYVWGRNVGPGPDIGGPRACCRGTSRRVIYAVFRACGRRRTFLGPVLGW